jgi:riboflavin kinase / FMN adenylyltransferase
MRTLYGYKNVRKVLKSPVLAIGIFDGIHLGHRKVIGSMMASSPGFDKAILTFDPHPETVLSPDKELPRIMSIEHRLRIFEEMGLDAAIVVRFSQQIAEMPPETFVDKVILGGIGSRRVFVGGNFYFGKGASGDTDEFIRIGRERGVEVRVVEPVRISGNIVSSTRVRELVAKGSLEEAEKLLGRPVSVLGTVVAGDGVGRSIGTPTANIDPHHEVVPPVGVYAVKVDIGEKTLSGVLNIGYKPTFYGRPPERQEPVIEVHILDFDGDLYGRHIEVFFVKKLRSEKKFKDREELSERIKKDIDTARGLM